MKYAGAIYRCGETDDALQKAQRAHLAHPGHYPVAVSHPTADSPPPRIEHGRWLVDCQCGSGAGVSQTGQAYCFECGAVMTIALPDAQARADAETLLGARPTERQHWFPERETIADLQNENRKVRV